MAQLNLDEIVSRIDLAFGDTGPISKRTLTPKEAEILDVLQEDSGYQDFVQDQINRQIIHNYLLNAVLTQALTEPQLAQLLQQASSREGRSTLSLSMLMQSVADAPALLLHSTPRQGLTPLADTDQHHVR